MSGRDHPPINEIFHAHLEEYAFWQEVASAVKSELERAIRHLRIPGKVEARAKTTGSVIGKTYRKPETYSDLANFRDLAGARVLVPFLADVEPLVSEVSSHPNLTVHRDEAKIRPPNALTYQARHLDVEVGPGFGLEAPWDAGSRKVWCEVQIQTFAQNLWANLSHLVTYKQDLPDLVHSRVNRLVVLCELFDDEVTESRRMALEEVDSVGILADELQRYFFGLTGVLLDLDQSIALVGRLMPSLDDEERRSYPRILDEFVSLYGDRLAQLLTDHPEARDLPWLLRPEVLLIFERLTNRPHALRTVWETEFYPGDLDRLESAWGPTRL